MAVDQALALLMVKTRLNRTAPQAQMDQYLSMRIQAAVQELDGMMPVPLTASAADMLLVVDYAVWQYQNRDKSDADPPWLRQRLRDRFLYRGGDAL